MRREFYCPYMPNNAYAAVSSCITCARNRVEPNLKRRLQLFPESDPLVLFAIDILGPLPRTADGNPNIFITNYRYSKLTQALPTGKTSSAYVTNVFFDSWIVPHGTPAYVLTDNEVHLKSSLFATLCTMPGMIHLSTMTYLSQTKGLVERYHRTIVN